MSKKVITVDPGCFTMGLCVWDAKDFLYEIDVCCPEKSKYMDMKVTERNEHGPIGALKVSINQIRMIFENDYVTICYCEKPRVFSSARGFASSIQGHIQYMDMFRGMLLSLCEQFDCEFIDVDVLDWKGQLPKHIVNDRIKDIIGKGTMILSPNESHDWDACGIGLYAQGLFE